MNKRTIKVISLLVDEVNSDEDILETLVDMVEEYLDTLSETNFRVHYYASKKFFNAFIISR